MDTPDRDIEAPRGVSTQKVKEHAVNIRSNILVFVSRLGRYEKYKSSVFKILGLVSLMLGLMLIVMSAYCVLAGEDAWIFFAMAPVYLLVGTYLYLRFSYAQISASMGILLITETWVLCFIAAILPFYLSGQSVIDSIYEGISGFTTTGSTMFDSADFASAPSSILLWRCLIEWVGGITVVIVFAFLLPMIGMGGRNLGSNEFNDGDSDFTLNVRSSAIGFFKVYSVLTITEALILTFFGIVGIDSDMLSFFNSVCIAMSNVSTGGLLPFTDSMASFSFITQFVTLIFMIAGASNFFIMLASISSKKFKLIHSHEWRTMILWFVTVGVIIAICVNYVAPNYFAHWETLWQSFYAVVSAGTSAGFAVSDYHQWPIVALVLLMIVQFVGGCSGSTAGGIKIHRLMSIVAYIRTGMEKVMHPGAVSIMEIDNARIDTDQAASILSTVLLFAISFMLGVIAILILEDISITDSMLMTVSAVSNAGCVIGTGSFSFEVSWISKLILCFLMYLGRMEMVYVLIIFTRGFWSDVAQSTSKRGREIKRIRR